MAKPEKNTAQHDAMMRGRRWVADQQNADGAFGYRPGNKSAAEPTILALAAGLVPDLDWVSKNCDGYAALLLPAIAYDEYPALCTSFLDEIEEQEAKKTPATDFDGSIPGWGWVAQTAAWVEPTSYGVLSLSKSNRGSKRVSQGRELLTDRQCEDGGWNYGNPRVTGVELAGQLVPSGWAVMALEASDVSKAGLAFMNLALKTPSTLALSLGALARARHGLDGGGFLAPLAARITDTGVRGRLDLTTMAVAALSAHIEGKNVFW